MTPDEFRRHGHLLVDWIADYRERIATLPVMSPLQPGAVRALLPTAPPQRPEPFAQLVSDLEQVILPGVTHWNHPSSFAYFPSNAGLASVLADLVSSGLGAQAMSWQTSPAATELEDVVLDWLRQMVGLSDSFTGVIQDTASTATLVALLCARERTSNHGQSRGGLQAEAAPLIVYASQEAHSSIDKAALLAGFGKDNVRHIATDDAFALIPEQLEAAIALDLKEGRQPCAIVASVGTTATTAVDPVQAIAGIARRYKLWLHVDAALAGSAMILPECRAHWAGVESADSLVFNPHKWLGVAFDCTAYYVKSGEHLVRVMSTNPSYLQTAADGRVRNLRDWGIPLGRRFRALKLWFLLRDQGVLGLQARLRRDLDNAQWLKEQIDAGPRWERLAPVPFQTVVIRHVPEGMVDEAALRPHNLKIAASINESGKAYLTPAVVKGRQAIRVSIGAEATTRAEVSALWSLLQQAASR